jgi:hypothetical protein
MEFGTEPRENSVVTGLILFIKGASCAPKEPKELPFLEPMT